MRVQLQHLSFLVYQFLNYCSPSQPLGAPQTSRQPLCQSVSQLATRYTLRVFSLPVISSLFVWVRSLEPFRPSQRRWGGKNMPLKLTNWQKDWERERLEDVNLESESLVSGLGGNESLWEIKEREVWRRDGGSCLLVWGGGEWNRFGEKYLEGWLEGEMDGCLPLAASHYLSEAQLQVGRVSS